MATSIIYGLPNSLGIEVLVNGDDYTAPCDGYFRVMCDYTAGNYVFGYVNAVRLICATTSSTYNSLSYPTACCFVRKGMVLKGVSNDFTNSLNTAKFYPIV